MAQYTPMIQQYLKIKAEYQDAFLFFRLGDFYEMFFEDALKASQVLEITLTSRDGGGEEKIPMCGVPYHAASGYIEQLIDKGYKVAICEQTEDPKQAKGVVKREVIQLITPGTVMDEKGLPDKENNYIASVSFYKEQGYAIAYTDLSTGESKALLLEDSMERLLNEIVSLGAKEIVVDPSFDPDEIKIIQTRCNAVISFENEVDLIQEFTEMVKQLHKEKLKKTAQRLLHYLKRSQKRSLHHLQPFTEYELNHYMKIDYFSKRNLEISESIRGKNNKGTLLWLLDETVTAMGGRLLRQWIDRPLIDESKIMQRLDMVETLLDHYFEREDMREKLTGVYDLERLSGRVAFGNANARDFIQLKKSLRQIPAIKQLTEQLEQDFAKQLADQLDPCEELVTLLDEAIVDNPPISVKEGNLIKDGFHQELDQYRDASRNGKHWIAQLEKDEREKTGIKSLKVGFNRVFGYYIEVTRANIHLLQDPRYERKQTLANSERYITPELKEKEALILQAEEKSIELEYELFLHIRESVQSYIKRIQQTAKIISMLDVFQCFATISEERHYKRPTFNSKRRIVIKDGRHPVVEKVMDSNSYVPNDCYMSDQREMLLITGPNMSGKSTYMRQIALISVMAQMGCFVPAETIEIPIFDQIFTRIGAADDLISGQSTFMVEMLEAKNALIHATNNSLILFDEIGRGTSTYDGMALAQAIIEYIHEHIGAKTLFSTHYHELTALEENLPKLSNIHVSAMEQQGKLVFLHKVKDGAADRSYGIHVAELAELPASLIQRANEVLAELEKTAHHTELETAAAIEQENVNIQEQLTFFDQPKENHFRKSDQKVLEKIRRIDILELTPMQAMNILYEIKKQLK
ncbi:DNA mismatch repair protein MutS [Lederbergia sp. NSJ-179]|uniref:DNA mismatch repair protein MutS n=1 Tax=Lederbergia sp. NSJ-179 TaxID=2931402 RepID=UPI001FD2B166|nr:DNA mismatch repair protein MutS [Lederbergia sp. NSJ-179]MCJ7841206.1 DNA mismatch repair protein MutS [Lederbergia sp. NSJ-179]